MLQPPRTLHIGIDTGGTFTDLIAWDGSSFRTAKVPSTPPDFHLGVVAAIHQILQPDETGQLIHGSTVATNALLERKGHPVALITTQGFSDLLLIGRQNRPVLYELEPRRAKPIVADEHVFTVNERIGVDGKVLTALDPSEIDAVINRLNAGCSCDACVAFFSKTGKEATQATRLQHIAVCLLFSFVNPIHEQLLGERLRAAGFAVTLSSELLPEFREYERASATVINAALRPNVQHYLNALSTSLPTNVNSLRIMHSGGGTLSPDDAGRFAARLLLSGPAGGVLGANSIANLEGFPQTITYDMGGTSTDVAAIIDGKPPWTTGTRIDGLPVPLAMFDIHTIGAGGGSIASIDIGGALTVGPQSAGAEPGPACYGRGGTRPTVTDANLVLGRLIPHRFLGGKMPLHRDRAEAALTPLASQMNKSVVETALGIVRIAESNMSAAIRHVTTGKGHDPRNFTLMSFGGAGGLHAAALAESLDIPQILIPPNAGLLSAFGMVVAPPLVDVSRTIVQQNSQISRDQLIHQYAQLSLLAERQLPADHTATIERFADCRFRGQSYELTIPVNELDLSAIDREFRAAYKTLYGHCPPGREVELVTLRLRRVGNALNLSMPAMIPRAMSPTMTTVVLPDGKVETVPIYDRPSVAAIGQLVGAAMIADADSTTFIPQGWCAQITQFGGIRLERI